MTAQTTAINATTDNLQLVEQLREKIQTVTSIGRPSDGATFSSGSADIDKLLPAGGYTRGTIIQWFNPPSRSRFPLQGYSTQLLSLTTAIQACKQNRQALVVIDPDHTFYPPAAAALGVSLTEVVILRPVTACHDHRDKNLFWAIDQALQSNAVGAVWGAVGNIDARWLRRFQLSAEQSGVVGCFVRPGRCLNQPSWSEVDWKVQPEPSKQTGQRAPLYSYTLSLQLIRAPGGFANRQIKLDINMTTGSVSRTAKS